MSARGEWLGLLERERHRIGGEVPNLVLLQGVNGRTEDTPGWKVQRLAA
jgi:hypothetical protein